MPTARASLRQKLGAARRRLAPRPTAKGDAELGWWIENWDRCLRDGGLHGPGTLALSGDETVAATYEGRRWQQARAEVRRVLREAAIDDDAFFRNKVVVDIGSGPLGFPDAVADSAASSISVEPLAERYTQAGLMLESRAVYLDCGAEAIPLRSGSVDVVVSRNNLDHVDEPAAVLAEIKRILRPGGTLILNVDVGHTPSVTEPHSIDLAQLRSWIAPLAITHEDEWQHSHGLDGHAVVIVARKD